MTPLLFVVALVVVFAGADWDDEQHAHAPANVVSASAELTIAVGR